MRPAVRDFVARVARAASWQGPVVEVGARRPDGQEELADMRPLFPRAAYVGMDKRRGSGADLLADACELPLAAGAAGVALCLETIEHVRQPGRVVAELARVLRAGGLCVVSSVMRFTIHGAPEDYWRFTPFGLAVVLDGAFEHYHVAQASEGNAKFPRNVVAVAVKGERPPWFAALARVAGAWQQRWS